jgi:hypothetical protein
LQRCSTAHVPSRASRAAVTWRKEQT